MKFVNQFILYYYNYASTHLTLYLFTKLKEISSYFIDAELFLLCKNLI